MVEKASAVNWYDVKCVGCGTRIHVVTELEKCPLCGTRDKPEPLPAMALATELVDAYLKRKEEALRVGPQILNGKEYAGLMLRMHGRIGALEGYRSLPRSARMHWRSAHQYLIKVRELEQVAE